MRWPGIVVAAVCGLLPSTLANAQNEFGGVRTFLMAPLTACGDGLTADIAVLGVPFDEGTSARPGARYGPRDIREQSIHYAWARRQGFYYIDGARTVLAGKRWVDCGDVAVLPTRPARSLESVTRAVRSILAAGAFPVVLGGDHSISKPIIAAYELPDLTIVHFDAHLDNYDGGEDDIGHGGWLHWAARLPSVKQVVQIGMRGLANDAKGVENAKRMRSTLVTTEELHRSGVQAVLSRLPAARALYVSIDIDVLDPSLAPGTGTPEVGGLTFQQLSELLRGVAEKGQVVGMDVVEVNAYHDPTGMTAQVAARLVIDLVGAALRP